jgi:hypothetical protein
MAILKTRKITANIDFKKQIQTKHFKLMHKDKSICTFAITYSKKFNDLYYSDISGGNFNDEKIKKLIFKNLKKIFFEENTTIVTLRGIKWFYKV